MSSSIDTVLQRLRTARPNLVSIPGAAAFASATTLWAKQVDKSPRAVFHCKDADDVQQALTVASEVELPVSVRGGGHDWAGRALCDGIVIDMTAMNEVRVDRSSLTVEIGGGSRGRDVAAATDPFDLSPVTGSVGAIGMAGLLLGGGYGPLIGRFGLALDNLLGAEVVLADGRIVKADHDNETELFWALRGAGGNMGVVTKMNIKAHALASVRSGVLQFSPSEARTVFQSCAAIMDVAPDELSVQLGFIGNGFEQVVIVVPTWSGLPEESNEWIAPFFQIGTLLAGAVEEMSYGKMLQQFDPYISNGKRVVVETCWLPSFASATDCLIEAMATAASSDCTVITHEFKGAASRVPVESTAFGLRQDHVLVEIRASFVDSPDRQDEERLRHWASATRQALNATALPGAYPNLSIGADPRIVLESYGPNGDRLMKVKQRYDPDNRFSSAAPLPTGDVYSALVGFQVDRSGKNSDPARPAT